jgi:hypothetical protein
MGLDQTEGWAGTGFFPNEGQSHFFLKRKHPEEPTRMVMAKMITQKV